MKIAIPVDENKQEVCVSFARAPYFMYYDTETKETIVKDNPAAEAAGGAGLKAAQALVDEKCDVLLTVRCGENAAEVLQAAKIQIYKTTGSDAKDNIKAYEEGNLEELTHFHAGFHGIQ